MKALILFTSLLLAAGCVEFKSGPSLEDLDKALVSILDAPGIYPELVKAGKNRLSRNVFLSRARSLKKLKIRLDRAASQVGAQKAMLKLAAGSPPTLMYGFGEWSLRLEFFYRPAVAVVLDDWGYKKKAISQLVSMPGPLNVAVIPALPYSSLAAMTAKKFGHEVLLHLPMQSQKGAVQEQTTIQVSMSDEQVRALIVQAFKTVPGTVGVNNHQGSLASADKRVMDLLMEELNTENQYFLDSRTSSESVGALSAAQAGVPYARRHVFLDNVIEEGAVAVQWDKVLDRALKKGECIAIGHPYPVTIEFLKKVLDDLKIKGIDLVRVSDLVKK